MRTMLLAMLFAAPILVFNPWSVTSLDGPYWGVGTFAWVKLPLALLLASMVAALAGDGVSFRDQEGSENSCASGATWIWILAAALLVVMPGMLREDTASFAKESLPLVGAAAVLAVLLGRVPLCRRSLNVMIASVAVASGLCALWAILESSGVISPFWERYVSARPLGTLGHRSALAHQCVLGLLSATLLAARPKAWSRIAAFATGPVLLTALILTRSRAAWLEAAVVLPVTLAVGLFAARLAPRTDRRRVASAAAWMTAAMAFAALTSWQAFSLYRVDRTLTWTPDGHAQATSQRSAYVTSLQSIGDTSKGSAALRLEQTRRGLESVRENPLLGSGLGTWGRVEMCAVARENPDDFPSAQAAASPDSDWLRILVENGFAGLILFLVPLVAVVRKEWRPLPEIVPLIVFFSLAGGLDISLAKANFLVPLIFTVAGRRKRYTTIDRMLVLAAIAAASAIGLAINARTSIRPSPIDRGRDDAKTVESRLAVTSSPYDRLGYFGAVELRHDVCQNTALRAEMARLLKEFPCQGRFRVQIESCRLNSRH